MTHPTEPTVLRWESIRRDDLPTLTAHGGRGPENIIRIQLTLQCQQPRVKRAVKGLLEVRLHAITLAQVRARSGADVTPSLQIAKREIVPGTQDLLRRRTGTPLEARYGVHHHVPHGRISRVVRVASTRQCGCHVKRDQQQPALGRRLDSLKGLVEPRGIFPICAWEEA